jgi:NADH-quinone oxidoreductase subunit L
MTVPLMILAGFAALAGLVFGPTGLFPGYLEKTPGLPEPEAHHLNWLVLGGGTVAALVGIGLAYAMYAKPRRATSESAAPAGGPLGALSYNRFYLDEIYNGLLVAPLRAIGWFGDWLDRNVIDNVVNLVAAVPRAVGAGLRPIQNGVVPSYALVMLFGLAVFFLSMVAMR